MARPTNEPTDEHRKRILQALAAIDRAQDRLTTKEADLAQAVRDANRDGASVRVLAELTGRGTNTIQKWLREG